MCTPTRFYPPANMSRRNPGNRSSVEPLEGGRRELDSGFYGHKEGHGATRFILRPGFTASPPHFD